MPPALRPRTATWELPALAVAMALGTFGEVALLHQGRSFLWLELALVLPLALVGLVVLSLRGRLARRAQAGGELLASGLPHGNRGRAELTAGLRAAMAREAAPPERARIGHLVLASMILGAACGYYMGRLRVHTGTGGIHREAIVGCLVLFPLWVLILCGSTRQVMTFVTGVVTLNLSASLGWIAGTADELSRGAGHEILQDLLVTLTVSTVIEVVAGAALIGWLNWQRLRWSRGILMTGGPAERAGERLVPRRLPLRVPWVLTLLLPGGMAAWYHLTAGV